MSGGAGVGKSHMLRDLIRELEADGMTCIKLGYTHRSSQILGGADGDTVLHFLKQHQRGIANGHKTWIILDEASLCLLKLHPLLNNFHKWLGVRFIISGDWGQMTPIAECWGVENFVRSESCHAMFTLCGGLRVEMSNCRRSDKAHFDSYIKFRSLKSWEDYPGGQAGACKHLEEAYPW